MSANLLLGDIEKAFLQISVKDEDRDAFRFLFNGKEEEKHLRFTRVSFGEEASPFLLGPTLQYHLEEQEPGFEDTVQGLKENTYVDNLMQTGGDLEQLAKFKDKSTSILQNAKFPVHKWEPISNVLRVKTCRTLARFWDMLEEDIIEFAGKAYPEDNLTSYPQLPGSNL